MPSQRVTFENEQGIKLAGILDSPAETPRHCAVFAHCFTCNKDLKAIVKISRRLAKQSIATLRFDFTGLGSSHGKFEESNFETNIADLKSAAAWLASTYQPPSLMMGLSLGGAAVMAVADQIPSLKAIATVATPSCTKHLAEFLAEQNPAIEADGIGMVNTGATDHPITTQLLTSLRQYDLETKIRSNSTPHLILHSPVDQTVKYQHAENLLAWTGGAKAMITLSDADHLLMNRRDDANWVADCIATWSGRYIG